MEPWILSVIFGLLLACSCAVSIFIPFGYLLNLPLGGVLAAILLLEEGVLFDIFGATPFSPLWWCFSFWMGVFALRLIVLSLCTLRGPPAFSAAAANSSMRRCTYATRSENDRIHFETKR